MIKSWRENDEADLFFAERRQGNSTSTCEPELTKS